MSAIDPTYQWLGLDPSIDVLKTVFDVQPGDPTVTVWFRFAGSFPDVPTEKDGMRVVLVPVYEERVERPVINPHDFAY